MNRQFATYQHYKGGIYLKVCEALHTETNETMVVYTCAARGTVYCRPKDMFEGTVEWNGQTVPRFRPLPNDINDQQKQSLKWFS